ncbi:phage tail tip lysozyme [Naasia sp. SYSU D00948]|uniref:phage tail tip lysozyme n=1 Tax=Naasia sp. SYSU D00948 TaxID=2817379 RepID=UPI001B30724B|nr:phage tail tip lysozyme [Naasia sp. SYSU D00948]
MTNSPWSAEWTRVSEARSDEAAEAVARGAQPPSGEWTAPGAQGGSAGWTEGEHQTAVGPWTDQWTTDQWATDQWATDQWATDQWAAEQWSPDQWAVEQWSPDQWAAGDEFEGLDEGPAIGEDERESAWAAEPAVVTTSEWEGRGDETTGTLGVLQELLAAETTGPTLTARLTGLAALAVGPALRRGSRGPAVAALQRVLTDLGYPLAADGDFGGRTDQAVRSFQSRSRLTPDGIVGAATKAALAAALAGRAGPGPTPPPVPTPPPTPVGPSGSGQDWSRIPAEQRARYVMGLLVRNYGYPVNGAAGLVGNLWAESEIIPNRVEGSAAATPMRAKDASGVVVDFTPDQIVHRVPNRSGPKLPGIGLAQWTTANRRVGLFQHAFRGRVLGGAILFDMDAQVDYLVHELRRSYPRVDAVLRRADVSVDDACDEVLYRFETPGSVLGPDRKLLPRTDPAVQATFRKRRPLAHRALRAYGEGR